MAQLLFRDLYHGNGDINVTAYANDPRCAGLILKLFEGENYDTSWFERYWPQLMKARDDGKFEAHGAYDWLIFHSNGGTQFLKAKAVIDKFGGWERKGVFPPFADVEWGQNSDATKASVIRCCKEWNTQAEKSGSHERILYGRSLINGFGITDHMGFTGLWTPRYPAGSPAWEAWQTWLGNPPVNGWKFEEVRLVQGSNAVQGASPRDLGGRWLDTSFWTGTLDELRAFVGSSQQQHQGGTFMADLTADEQKEMYLTLKAAGNNFKVAMGVPTVTEAYRKLAEVTNNLADFLASQGYPKP